MNKDICGVILAGGRSSRFGSNKALALFENKPLIVHIAGLFREIFEEVVVVSRDAAELDVLKNFELRFISDLLPDFHPLGGLYSALSQIKAGAIVATACDTPKIQRGLIEILRDTPLAYAGAACRYNGVVQPLPGLYRKNLLGLLELMIREEGAGLADLCVRARARIYLEPEIRSADAEGLSFLDVDTFEDLRKMESHASI